MKWSAVAALCAVSLALAGVMDADLVERGMMSYGSSKSYSSSNVIVVEETIVLWVNYGGGSSTTTMNKYSSVMGSSGPAQTHTVVVGGPAGLIYSPDTIEAAIGDLVIFEFGSENHTATQSAFAFPCVKNGTFDSGFMPNINGSVTPAPQIAMQVMVDTPLWFYCKQKNPKPHCGAGMTFSINPTLEKTQADFKQMAIAQNGTATDTAGIVGGSSSAAAAATTMAVAQTSTVMMAAATGASSMSSSSASSSGSYMSSGSGSMSSGQCECACFCGLGSFPSAVQGLEMSGGMAGSMPMSAMMH